ncbi:MAG: response regulator [Flavobacterium sp.]|nr:MAG: response regulator [Flavobacterium sp.]
MGSEKLYRVMLADDDPDDRDLFTEAINEYNADVDSVANGVQLMSALQQKVNDLPDLIFLDLNMPEKGGKECLREIRGDKKLKDVPVLIYSTSSSKKDIDETFELGANLYITKPSSFSELRRTIKDILDMDWSKDQPASNRNSFVFGAS